MKKWSLALKADAKPCSWPPFGTANQQGPSSRVPVHRPGIGPAAGVSQQAAEFSIMEYWLWSSVAIPPSPSQTKPENHRPCMGLATGPKPCYHSALEAGEAINLIFVGVEFNFRPTKFRKIP